MDKEKIRDRIEELKYLQEPYDKVMFTLFAFLVALMGIFMTITYNKSETVKTWLDFANFLKLIKIFSWIFFLTFLCVFLFNHFYRKYDKLIKNNYDLLLERKNKEN
jgi:hypothetical protein